MEPITVLTTLDPGNHAHTTRDWRYLHYANGDEELDDIANDPHEWHNLARDENHHPRLTERQRRLQETLAPLGDWGKGDDFMPRTMMPGTP